ncbi:MAG: hypothetical protein KAG34_10550 [Cocleimonas sp.]|nr:hypothetical protein [Cocleimonas sp.]
MHQTIRKLSKPALLLLLLISGCSHTYKPLAHVTEASMKEATIESYATLKESAKELKDVFLPVKPSKENGQ